MKKLIVMFIILIIGIIFDINSILFNIVKELLEKLESEKILSNLIKYEKGIINFFYAFETYGLSILLDKINYFKKSFTFTITQRCEAFPSQTICRYTSKNDLEKARTVKAKINFSNKNSLRSYILKKYLKNKRIFLKVLICDNTSEYLVLESDEFEVIGGKILKKEITSYFIQALGDVNEGFSENYSFIITDNLDDGDVKTAKPIIETKLLIKNKYYIDSWLLKRLFKVEKENFIVEVNIDYR